MHNIRKLLVDDNPERPALASTACAVGSTVTAVGIRLLLDPVLGDLSPYSVLLFAVLLTACFGGVWPALLTVVLGVAAGDYFLIPPRGAFGLKGAIQYTDLALFVGVAVGIAVLGGVMQRAPLKTLRQLRAAAKSLAEADERLRLSLTSSGVGTWTWNVPANHVEEGGNLAPIFGFPAGQFPRTLEAFMLTVHPSDRDRVQADVQRTVSGGVDFNTEFRIVRPDGSIRSVISRGKAYYGSEGGLDRVTGVCWDVTEHRQTEEDLRAASSRLAAEGKFRELLDAAPDGVVVANLRGEIVLLNTQAERVFGYPRQDLLGRSVDILTAASNLEKGRGPAMLQLRDGSEFSGIRADGTMFPAEIHLNPLETEDGPLVLCSIRDITQRKQAEQEILDLNARLEQSASEAQAASRAKSVFLSTMSHEIRTPLNAILGYAQLMMRDPHAGSEAKDNLRIISRSGEHLLSLINEILDMSRIEAERAEVKPVTFDLRAMLDDLAAMFRLRAQAKALEFEMIVYGVSSSQVTADEGKIRQVLINLLGNAIKFTSRGYVRLHANLEENRTGQLWLHARVDDSGPGMSREETSRLFEPFSQTRRGLDASIGDEAGREGTGLGLAISRNYARLMGGDVTVTSIPGMGSTFRFEIPICALSVAASPGVGNESTNNASKWNEQGSNGSSTSDVRIPENKSPTMKSVTIAPELTNELLAALRRGNKALIDSVIARIGDSEEIEYARMLQKLADEYDYDSIFRLLDAAIGCEETAA
jgi:PAS domain S-box-containing protein